MTIETMLEISRSSSCPVDPYWGESTRTMKLLVAYYKDFNVNA